MSHSTAALREQVGRIARFPLAHLPTPLEFLPRLTGALGGPRIFIKRDDCTGLAFGGNKTRHNEYLIADALARETDLFVWGAGVQSNNCRQTAAACVRAGLDCHLVLGRDRDGDLEPVQGNLLLDHILGAEIEIVTAAVGPELDARIDDAAARFREQGRRVYAWDRDRVKPLAALSYVICMVEIAEQSATAGIAPRRVYVCSAGSTGAGLALGSALLGRRVPVTSIAPLEWPWDTQQDMLAIAQRAAEQLAADVVLRNDDIDVRFDQIGTAYGAATEECLEAIALLARTEAILVDPIYSGKALAGLIADIRAGQFTRDECVVFVHTGGTPALFAHNDLLANAIPGRVL